jgi:hypothetical protein
MKSIKPIFNIFGILAIFLLCLNSCVEKPDDCLCACLCRQDEVCLDGECFLSEYVHSLGGTTLIAPNSYVGFVEGNLCVDTLVFFNDTTRDIFNQFGLFVAVPGGIQNVAGSHATMVSEKEYYSYSSAPLCYLNGEARYANLHFVIEADSVNMDLKFWELGSGVFIDSCTVVFYKKQ